MRRRKRTEIRQDEIARVVLELIADDGPEALSMVSVAKRIGVVPSALYRHYPCKEDMILAAMKLHRDEKLQELDRLIKEHGSVIRAYKAHTLNLPVFMGQTAAFPRVGFGKRKNTSQRMANEMRGIFSSFLKKVEGDLERAQTDGEIAMDVNCEAAANALWGLLVTGVIRYAVLGPEFDAMNHVKHGWDFWLRSVGAQPSESIPVDQSNELSTSGRTK